MYKHDIVDVLRMDADDNQTTSLLKIWNTFSHYLRVSVCDKDKRYRTLCSKTINRNADNEHMCSCYKVAKISPCVKVTSRW